MTQMLEVAHSDLKTVIINIFMDLKIKVMCEKMENLNRKIQTMRRKINENKERKRTLTLTSHLTTNGSWV